MGSLRPFSFLAFEGIFTFSRCRHPKHFAFSCMSCVFSLSLHSRFSSLLLPVTLLHASEVRSIWHRSFSWGNKGWHVFSFSVWQRKQEPAMREAYYMVWRILNGNKCQKERDRDLSSLCKKKCKEKQSMCKTSRFKEVPSLIISLLHSRAWMNEWIHTIE